MVTITTNPCPVCGKRSEVEVDEQAARKWASGMLAQDAFPEMSKDTRELLITGTHPKCWDELFPEDYAGELDEPEDGLTDYERELKDAYIPFGGK